MSPPAKRAFLASFSVYLLPIIGPHSLQMFGAVIAMEFAEGWERGPLWIAADIALALFLQLLTGLLAYWCFLKPSWKRFVAFVPAIPLLWATLMWSYLQEIPRYFLVDSGRSPEIETWAEECRITDAYLPDLKTPADLSLEKAGRAFIARSPDSDLGLLQMPGCEVTEVGIQWSNYSPRIHSVAATGAVLYSLHDKASDTWSWWVIERPGTEPRQLDQPPHTEHPEPLLSTDGKWVVWIQRIPTEGRQTRPALLITALDGGEPQSIDLQAFAPSRFRLHHFDYDAGEIAVTLAEEEFLGLGLDGALRWGPWNPERVKAWAGTRRRVKDGWVAWDAYRDSEPYQLEWLFAQREGRHTVQRGYGIESAAVEPGGRYIALSIDGRYTFSMPDSIYVLRTSDTQEVFRQYLPQYNRSQVAFLGSEFFAYKDGNDVRVLRIDPDE